MQRNVPPSPDHKEPLVMVVDDELEIVDIVQVVLQYAGFRVLAAASGEGCLAALQTVQPDLILLDIMMPGLSGWDVLDHLRADPRLRTIPVMMLTALAQDSEIRRGLAAGAVEYLVKPFDLVGLLHHVNWALNESTPEEREAPRRRLLDKLRLAGA
ncbi:MAG: response regulator [Candidatus Sericytochromatia bacterium]|nr:response regulator [Candidatus Sericytochromatia bacterium]